jgi:hypothetical protein
MNAKSETLNTKRPAEILHRKQAMWQIYFPMVLVLLLFIGLAVLIISGATSAPETNQKLANISTMYLFIPILILSLPILAILVGLIYLVSRVFPYISRYGTLITEKMEMIREWIDTWMDQASKPFIAVPSLFSGFRQISSELIRMLRSNFNHE